jgi:hypothetical protein
MLSRVAQAFCRMQPRHREAVHALRDGELGRGRNGRSTLEDRHRRLISAALVPLGRTFAGRLGQRFGRHPAASFDRHCHPMTPYMAQGAATSIEGAAVLARCLKDVPVDGIEAAFKRFEAHRKPRTSKIQAISSANIWMSGGNDDPSWLYGYDAWTVSLDEPAPTPGTTRPPAAAA